MSDRVLLTGISGFLGGHVALQLLNAGYTVRGSVRNLGKADKVRDTLSRAGGDISRLEIVALNLLEDSGWTEAASDCRYLQHIASPFVIRMPKDKMDLIRPAVEGTERALHAAVATDVERIVLTSSTAAIAYGHDRSRTAPFTAGDWTNLASDHVPAYQESKTRAERRAWEIMDAADRHDDLVTINPGAILGPLLDEDPGTSAAMVSRLLDGSVPAVPDISMSTIDVRDVAAAHVAAMTAPTAGGQRFPMSERTLSFIKAADHLRATYPDRRIPRFTMPNWVVRLYSLFDRDMRGVTAELGIRKVIDSSAVIALLGRSLLPAPDAILATAESLIAQELL